MRAGRPVTIILGVGNLDAEDLAWASDAASWEVIEARRREPGVSRAELERLVEREVAHRERTE
jgi:hypothetical protein